MTFRSAAALGIVSATAGIVSLVAQSGAPALLRGELQNPQIRCGTFSERDVSGRLDPFAYYCAALGITGLILTR